MLENFIEEVGCALPGGLSIVGLMVFGESIHKDQTTALIEMLKEATDMLRTGEVSFPELALYNVQAKNRAVEILNVETGSLAKVLKTVFKPLNDQVMSVTLKLTTVLSTPTRNLETYSQIDNNNETHMVSL